MNTRFLKCLLCPALVSVLAGCGRKAACPAAAPGLLPYAVYREARVGQVKPAGWLRQLLERQRDGLGLHHAESGYPYNTCLWAGEIPKGWPSWGENWWPYEQSAYLVDGLTRASLLLDGDARLMAEVKPSLDAPLPAAVVTNTLWPLAVYERARIARDGDARSLADFFRTLPPVKLPGCTRERELAVIEGMCLAGDTSLVAKAEGYWLAYSSMSNRTVGKDVEPNPFYGPSMAAGRTVEIHGVTASEIGKLPALLYLATGKKEYLVQSLGFFNGILRDHLLADGAVSSAEGLYDRLPNSEHETCTVNDMMWSWGYLLEATGDGVWGDRIERAFFNAALGAISKDFKSFQYFSSPNQAYATEKSTNAHFPKHWSWWPRQAYRPGNDTECCAGNVHRLLPTYITRMWMTAPDGGPVAVLFGPSTFAFAQGSVEEITDYPFSGKIVFRFHLPKPAKFTFRCREPNWAGAKSSGFREVTRTWSDGQEFAVDYPMAPHFEPYQAKDQGVKAVAVVRGPLVFTPVIAEHVETITNGFKCSPAFPAYNLTPASPWNLAVNAALPIKEESRALAAGAFPWDPGASPVVLKVACSPLPSWTATERTPPLPASLGDESAAGAPRPIVPVTFVPSGSTRLRMDVLPVLDRR